METEQFVEIVEKHKAVIRKYLNIQKAMGQSIESFHNKHRALVDAELARLGFVKQKFSTYRDMTQKFGSQFHLPYVRGYFSHWSESAGSTDVFLDVNDAAFKHCDRAALAVITNRMDREQNRRAVYPAEIVAKIISALKDDMRRDVRFYVPQLDVEKTAKVLPLLKDVRSSEIILDYYIENMEPLDLIEKGIIDCVLTLVPVKSRETLIGKYFRLLKRKVRIADRQQAEDNFLAMSIIVSGISDKPSQEHAWSLVPALQWIYCDDSAEIYAVASVFLSWYHSSSETMDRAVTALMDNRFLTQEQKQELRLMLG